MAHRNKVIQEVADYIGRGQLRDDLRTKQNISEEAIQWIIDVLSMRC